jgi:hypothetical protein
MLAIGIVTRHKHTQLAGFDQSKTFARNTLEIGEDAEAERVVALGGVGHETQHDTHRRMQSSLEKTQGTHTHTHSDSTQLRLLLPPSNSWPARGVCWFVQY